jgi:alpha-tubulin suppressor-like RCC1 family protein
MRLTIAALAMAYSMQGAANDCGNFHARGAIDATLMQVPGMSKVAAVFGVWGVMAIRRDGTVLNWSEAATCFPKQYAMPPPLLARKDVTAYAKGNMTLATLRKDGTVWEWTYPYSLPPVQTVGGVERIAMGESHALAVSAGSVLAWGYHGECGEGGVPVSDASRDFPNGFGPRQVAGLNNVVAVSAGRRLSVALRSDGTVWWWGNLTSHDMRSATWQAPRCWSIGKDPSFRPRPPAQPVPQRVAGLDGVTAIATGHMHHLALKRDGSVWAWGSNDCGQLGTAPQGGNYLETFVATPARVEGVPKARAIGAGTRHSLALAQDGTVFAWGVNSHGQLDGKALRRKDAPQTPTSCRALNPDSVGGAVENVFNSVPTRVPNVAQITAIAAGPFSSIALKKDGTVWLWGLR